MQIGSLNEFTRRMHIKSHFDDPFHRITGSADGSGGPGDPPTKTYKGVDVAVGSGVTNLLDEVVVRASASKEITATGSAGPDIYEQTDRGERYYAFKAEGEVKGEYGKLEGSISGFSAGYEGYLESGGIHGNASAYALYADAGIRLGTINNNIAIEGNGSLFSGEVIGDAGIYTGANNKYGVELGGEAGVYAVRGQYSPSVSIFGVKIGITIGASVGSAHIGGRAAAIYDSNTNQGELTLMGHIGLGAGTKVGFSISNTSQEVNRRKR